MIKDKNKIRRNQTEKMEKLIIDPTLEFNKRLKTDTFKNL